MVIKKKVLHLQLLPLLSGVQNVTVAEISGLREDYKFHLMCAKEGPLLDTVRPMGVVCYTEPYLVREVSLTMDLYALVKIYRHIKLNAYNIVHTHSSKPGFIGRIAAKFAGVPMVIHTVHGFAFDSSPSRLKRIIYFVMEFIAALFTDRLLVMNKSDLKFCERWLPISNNKVIYLPNGIDDALFERNKSSVSRILISKLSNCNQLFRILFVGRLCFQKNPELLVKSITFLHSMGFKDIKLYFIGDGDLRPYLEQLSIDLGVSEYLEFLGWMPDAAHLIHEFDAFVLPSNYEGMPLSVIEAMASGTPVVASDIPGNNDLISHGLNGLLFEKGSAQDLAFKLAELISSPCFAQELSRAAYFDSYDKYRSSVHCRSLYDIYESKDGSHLC